MKRKIFGLLAIVILGYILVLIILIPAQIYHDSKSQTKTIAPGQVWSFSIESEVGDNIEIIIHHASLPIDIFVIESNSRFQFEGEYIWKVERVTNGEWNWVIPEENSEWYIVISNPNDVSLDIELTVRVDNGIFMNILSSEIFLPGMVMYGVFSGLILCVIIPILIYNERRKKINDQTIVVAEEIQEFH